MTEPEPEPEKVTTRTAERSSRLKIILNVLFALGVVRKDYSEWSLESDFV